MVAAALKSLIAICTFNPNPDLLDKVFESCLTQSVPGRIILIDSKSTTNVASLAAIKYDAEYFSCENAGIAEARYLALKKQQPDELLIFVDDDNILEHDFVRYALENARDRPNWGVFGGKLQLPIDYKVSKVLVPFLPYLAIKDLGSSVREEKASLQWNELEPPGAGVCIRPEVTGKFLENISTGNRSYFQVGALGNKQFRGEDSFIARQAFFLGLYWGYDPRLQLVHRFDKSRLQLRYVTKLLFRYGISDVRLNESLQIDPAYPYPSSLSSLLVALLYHLRKGLAGFPTALRVIGQHKAARKLHLRQVVNRFK